MTGEYISIHACIIAFATHLVTIYSLPTIGKKKLRVSLMSVFRVFFKGFRKKIFYKKNQIF